MDVVVELAEKLRRRSGGANATHAASLGGCIKLTALATMNPPRAVHALIPVLVVVTVALIARSAVNAHMTMTLSRSG